MAWPPSRRYTLSMKPSLSVVVITHNEEANIARCLGSVKRHRFRDIVLREMLVVDSKSDDATVKVAKRLGAQVVVRPWPGFSAQKNWALARVKGDWVLSLDADEEMTEALWREIERVLPEAPATVGGYALQRRAFFLGKWIRHCGWWPDAQTRVFRRGAGRFNDRAVHEGLEVEGDVETLSEPMDHHTYASIGQYLEKMDRYSALVAASAPERKRRLWPLYLVVDPFTTFFRGYVLRKGFLDGWHGFVLCGLSAFHSFVKYARIWEKESGRRGA